MKWLLRIAAGILVVAGILGAAGYYLTHNVDWARVYYKRLKAPNPYAFEEIDPQYRETDPAKLIRIDSADRAAEIRTALTGVILGPGIGPQDVPPAVATPGGTPSALADLAASATRLEIPVDLGYTAHAYLLDAEKPNGRLVIYQNGYAGTVSEMTPLIAAYLRHGFSVLALDYPGYGENNMGRAWSDRFGWYELSHDHIVDIHPQPMRFYVEPVIVALNFATARTSFSRIDMTGFSAGGWITTLTAAIDPRIRYSVAVAGGYPLYLRVAAFENQSPPPQLHQPLLQAANYLEMYALAGWGPGRGLTQIFNRFDRCCYRNTLGKLYEAAVRDAVGRAGEGGFEVLIDETHADHKVSDWAIDRILERLDVAK
jgi:pimeloyl-ACP methyl ester carboxylesterase